MVEKTFLLTTNYQLRTGFNMRFADPIYLLILIIAALAVFFDEKFRSAKKSAAVTFPGTGGFGGIGEGEGLAVGGVGGEHQRVSGGIATETRTVG